MDAAALLGAGAVPRARNTPAPACRCCRSRHGDRYTGLQILLYTLVLLAATLLPFAQGMSGWLYLAAALALGARFIHYAWRLWREYSELLARKTFRFSIWHLSLLFAALLIDHYLRPWL